MAELEAITNIPSNKDRPTGTTGQFGRRLTLTINQPVRLGRDEAKMDWAIPEDDQISRYYANVKWNGSKLEVERRGSVPPDYPEPPANKIVVVNKDQGARDKFREVTECLIGSGESFWIGQTQFTLHSESDFGPESPVDMTVAPKIAEFTRGQLEEIRFANPEAALKAMEQLPAMLRSASNESGLFRQMLKVVMEALPRADAAGIVRVPPGSPPGERRLALVESNVRSPVALGPKGFVPSRKLSYKAIQEPRKRSHLHIWSTDPKDAVGSEAAEAADMTLATMHQQNVTPWAICTPFQDGSKDALYISGRVNGQWAAMTESMQAKTVNDLTQYQKIADLIVGLMEMTLRISRLSKQNTVIRQAWPRGIWKYLDDPARLEELLKPGEKEVTILFCDLRNYSLFATKNQDNLLAAQRDVAFALDAMSGTITTLEGVVAGFRGDAVLGFWGWPWPHEKQLEKAAQAAVSIRERIEGNLLAKRCGLGLTHGTAVAGRLGAHDLAVVDLYGPVVNLAFRLEAMTKAFGVGVIVTQEVADRVAKADPDHISLRTRKLGMVLAKGFTEPVAAYELFGVVSRPDWTEWQAQEWLAVVENFTEGKWAEALDTLTMSFPDDSAGECLIRFMELNKRKPPANWDGSFAPSSPGD